MRTGNILTGDASAIDVPKLIERLETMVESSRQIMNKALWIDVEEFFVLTNKIKASLPDDVRKATRVTREAQRIGDDARLEAEQILDRAKKEAERTVMEARAESERLKDTHEITRMATTQAKEVIAQAEASALEMRRGADAYAGEVLARLEDEVTTVMRTIQKGREKLERDSR